MGYDLDFNLWPHESVSPWLLQPPADMAAGQRAEPDPLPPLCLRDRPPAAAPARALKDSGRPSK